MVAWLYRMMCVLTILLTTYSHDQSCICHQPLYDQHLRNGWQPRLCPAIPIAQESHVFSMPTGSSEPALGSACPLPPALMATSSGNLCSSILTLKKNHRFIEGASCMPSPHLFKCLKYQCPSMSKFKDMSTVLGFGCGFLDTVVGAKYQPRRLTAMWSSQCRTKIIC